MHFARSAFGKLEALRAFWTLTFTLVLAGCSPAKRADLIIVNGKEPESLDPALIVGQANGRVVLAIFEGLTRYNTHTAHPEPGLSDRWDISPDGRTYTFHIRTNACWSTGDPITAHDAAYSWTRILDPATGGDYAGILYYVKNGEAFNAGKIKDTNQLGFHAIDDRTFVVELNDPTLFFLDLCAYPTLCVVPRQTIERRGDSWLKARPLPCSGSYELVFWKLNDRVRVRKNPHYWDAANTQTEVIDLLACGVPTSALNLYETKEVDIIWDKDLVPSELLDALRHRPDFHHFDFLGSYFYRYNVRHKPFDDPRVRKALALAIDKKSLVEKITRGGERAVDCIVPPGLPNYTSPPGLGYNPAEARRLLAEAGFPDGKDFPRFTYLLNSSRDNEKIAVELQGMWQRELNIHAELRALEWAVYLRSQAEGDYDLSRSSWIGDYGDPNTFLDIFMSTNPNNRTGWKEARYDALLREANSLTDVRARAAKLAQAEAMVVRDEAVITPIYIYSGFNFFDTNRISGIHNNLLDEHPMRAIKKRL